MQTGTRDYYGKNQYWTPPNMTTTESLIGNALRSIDITGEVSGNMFSINANNEIEPIDDLTIRTSEMKVTTVDDTDDDSVVNMEYLSNQVNALDNIFLTLTQATNTYETIANHNADKEALQTSINSKANAADVYTKTESDDRYAPKGSPAELLDTVECDFVDETAYWSTFDAAKVEIVRFNAIASGFDYELAFSAAFLASHYPELGTSSKVWVQVNGGSYMQCSLTGSLLHDVTMHDARNEGQAGKLEYFRSSGHVRCSAGDEIVFSFSIATDPQDQGTYTLYLQPNSDDWPRYFRASFSIAGNDYYTKYEADERFEPKSTLQANYYDKTAVDGIRTAIVNAADAKYLQKTGGTMSGTLNMEKAQGDYMCFYDNTDTIIGSIGNDNGNLRMYSENGNLVLESINDVVLTASGDIRLEDANVSIGTTQDNRDLTVHGECTVNSKLTVNNWVEINDELVVNGGQSSFHDEVVFTSPVYMRDDVELGTSGNTVTLNKAFFDSILARLHALDGQ